MTLRSSSNLGKLSPPSYHVNYYFFVAPLRVLVFVLYPGFVVYFLVSFKSNSVIERAACFTLIVFLSCADPEEGERWSGPPPPLKNHKNIGFQLILIRIP